MQGAQPNMAYLQSQAVNTSLPIAPLNAPPHLSQPEAVTPEAVVARMLEVFRGMQLLRAQEAVLHTTGTHRNVDEWFHAASTWLEQEECRALAQAMSTSLDESQQEKARQKPVAEMTHDELMQRFQKSAILPEMMRRCGGSGSSSSFLLQPPLRQNMVDLLELERQSHQWYPCSGTCKYFSQLATKAGELMQTNYSGLSWPDSGPPAKKQRVEPAAGEEAGAASDREGGAAATGSTSLPASAAPAAASAESRASGASNQPHANGHAQASSSPAAALPPASTAAADEAARQLPAQLPPEQAKQQERVLQHVHQSILHWVHELQEGLYKMPSRGGATPQIFEDLCDPADESSEDDDNGVELISHSPPEAGPVDLL
ncbi:hypothetical protein WJX74_002849 [Apatococcus lobatus]|uniref:Uncharacterized protein n=1 Tax=Apatococcus lobatus TaxID=904363 RepID=A0AAW1RIP9_9CHLO